MDLHAPGEGPLGVMKLRKPTTIAHIEQAGLSTIARYARNGGPERRSAERYEGRAESAVKDAQRAAVRDWLTAHHPPGSRMRLLSMPDEHWTFENRMNDRPNTTFLGLQRDWTTLERGVPWMPLPDGLPSWSTESKAFPFYATARSGDIQGYRRGNNIVLHMWAGHALSWDNIGRTGAQDAALRTGVKHAKGLRHVTAAWLDFTGSLSDEVAAAIVGVPTFLGGTNARFPVVVSFLGARDAFCGHEERVAHVLIAVQQATSFCRSWHYRFDRFEVHTGTSPFVSIFGTYHCARSDRVAESPNPVSFVDEFAPKSDAGEVAPVSLVPAPDDDGGRIE